ncbi:sprT-like domain-containing protein Spartan [Acyrthosiphon pisum]|uniref:Protein with SprT-like domain at the N terminus n=1 Tax=Acyrthosiphon pisum TaxID=7029 RepID=A0A8R2H6S0_ACYPI|nr:sprT-like domain-containing protein Spartan [Acyrthosiphon pisum]XP_016660599.1 sprT-like domain-containing protein Spartan [Acyrthosiphon pisum]XP_029345197.1 sprT-like domain-containing protein Spartan [Acyrthosiphon pisum]|eukprot:XP_001943450.2 PREDICTED: sprT-like domain-containing protein Spartan [Acyrthosiphon pisum]
MDTSNDYLFALQLQNDLANFEENEDLLNVIDVTKSNTSLAAELSSESVIDLTDINTNVKKQKRNAIDNLTRPIKRPCPKNVEATESVVDHSWEMLDPNPDIHGLFLAFNRQYFWSKLDSVMIQWSKRMTVCAGLCRYENGFCSISLSEPLLKLRPRKDLVETLLHEMIHAYLFLTNNKDHKNRDGHGPEFCKHMYRINAAAGTKISIYHDFHEEVNVYKIHWWKCNGPCQYKKPFYGNVRRCQNRAPGPYDRWWTHHQATCSGIFIKIKEPEGFGLKKKPIVSKQVDVKPVNKITNFITILDSPINKVHHDGSEIYSKSKENDQKPQFDNKSNSPTKKVSDMNAKMSTESNECDKQNVQQGVYLLNDLYEGNDFDDDDISDLYDGISQCPVCNKPVLTDWLNDHLQNCKQLREMFGDEINDECKCPACNCTVERTLMNEHLNSCKMLINVFENDSEDIPDDTNYVNCPCCDKMVKDSNINTHLDICMSTESLKPNHDKNNLKCPCCENIFKNVIELDDHIDNCSSVC